MEFEPILKLIPALRWLLLLRLQLLYVALAKGFQISASIPAS
jgi:hypothetical protein